MPQLPPVRLTPRQTPVTRGTDVKADPLDALTMVRDDPALPAQLREKISGALARLREARKPAESHSLKSATPKSFAQSYFEEMISGHAPLRFSSLHSDSQRTRTRNFDIASSRLPGSVMLSSRNALSQRASPALQSPKEVFAELNAAAYQRLRYIDEVEQIEFDVANVREHDGSVMENEERLFLSVCCSVFANFSFFTSLRINAEKFFHFLEELFTRYPRDNSYHNSTHAADALQMMSLFLREPTVNFLFSDEEIAICFLAVLAIDVAHPGSTDALLVVLDHPLASVFGDVAIAEHASLLVMTSALMRDDNFFFATSDEAASVDSAHLVKEALYDVVLNAASRNRPSLTSALHDIEVSGRVTDVDAPKLMAALVVMASNSFAFRSQAQCCRIGASFLSELHREESEMQRHGIPVTVPRITAANSATVLSDYINVVVKPLASATHALVPTDLYDRLEGNADLVGVLNVNSTHAALSSNSVPVMDILKKVATHASSIDRKASKCAILNASPSRSRAAAPCVMMADSFSSMSSASGSANATRRDENIIISPPPLSISQLHAAESNGTVRPGRSEHYFSFLRLYDKCERAGEPAEGFVGQLVFLALQLDPRYIASYARKAYGDDCCGAQCVEMGRLIVDTEEAPTSAEVIASRVPGGPFSTRATDDADHTDGFILFLMHMYCSREGVLSEIDPDTPKADRADTPSPAETTTFEAAPQYVQNSPIRLPVNTENKHKGDRPRLIP